jgi:diadenosine tetraphosphate (Ap4A) HIT family hydrolase
VKDSAGTQKVNYEALEIYVYGGWIWQVHENQSYLGRLIFRLRRADLGSLADCTPQEWLSLHRSIAMYEALIRSLFQPDRFNYGQLGNTFHQLRVHAVPRYQKPRVWHGVEFQDQRWGQNWSPTPKSPLGLNQTYEFVSFLRECIESLQPAIAASGTTV